MSPLLIAILAPAMAQTCPEFSTYENGLSFGQTQERVFWLNVDSFMDSTVGYDEDEIEAMVISAAERWNHQANSGVLVYGGRTTQTGAPDLDVNCNSTNRLNVVEMVDWIGTDTTGRAEPRCRSNGVGDTFSVRIAKNRGASNAQVPWGWNTTSVRDLEEIIVHELGHTFNLWHPADTSAPATMLTSGQASSASTTWGDRRELRDYDIACAKQLSDDRWQNEAVVWLTFSSGSPWPLATGFDVTRATMTYFDWTINDAFAYQDETCVHYQPGSTTPWCATWESADAASGPEGVVWTDDGTAQVLVSLREDVVDDPNDIWTWRHPVVDVAPSQFFAEQMETCADMANSTTDVLVCSSTARDGVHSARRVATAYNEALASNGRTMVAWANQADFSDPEASEVFLSVGRTSGGTWAEPTRLNVFSDVGPGLACAPDQAAGGRDCLLATVDPDNPMSEVVVTPISQYWSSYADRYYSTRGTSVTTSIQTGADIAVWYQDDWFLAVKSFDGWVRIYRSTDGGVSWTEDGTAGQSIVGPEVVTAEDGSYSFLITVPLDV